MGDGRWGTGEAYSFTSSFSLKDVWVLGLGSTGGASAAWSLANSLAFHLPLKASTIATSARCSEECVGMESLRVPWDGAGVGLWEC